MTPKQVEAGAAAIKAIAIDYVEKNVPALFKGTAESALASHPELFTKMASAAYTEMEKHRDESSN